MQPSLKVIGSVQSQAYHVLVEDRPFFYPSYHFHPQYEIMLLQESTGTRIVGDSIEGFKPGDVVFLGRNLPHIWRNDEEYYKKNSKLKARAVVIYFKEDFLGGDFLILQEMHAIKQLFERSKRGMIFTGQAKRDLQAAIEKVPELEGMDRLIALLNILNSMARTSEFRLISGPAFNEKVTKPDSARIDRLYNYVLDNHKRSISLHAIAEYANMNPSSFCRYFKSKTGKSFVSFLNEIRIGNACKMLVEGKQSVTQICYEVGFNNFSNFSRQFKKIKGCSPVEFQRRHLQKREATVQTS